MSVGDYNAFQFSDGLVDVLGVARGSSAPVNEVVAPGPDLVEPDYINLVSTLSRAPRYSYVFGGNAQFLDHILVNTQMSGRLTRFGYVRNNADFPEVLRNDPNRPERISNHDMPVATFRLP